MNWDITFWAVDGEQLIYLSAGLQEFKGRKMFWLFWFLSSHEEEWLSPELHYELPSPTLPTKGNQSTEWPDRRPLVDAIAELGDLHRAALPLRAPASANAMPNPWHRL